ncbi:GGDEF domain-containing protein [Oceaniserpentilla sp. 4NH20-0058]|uniref:GGDEF domain-containing protein n=1 Tax=Oceaniserpentilla sp. 4NH20-0058 TaxID=3127660 RepID=UPI003108C1DD
MATQYSNISEAQEEKLTSFSQLAPKPQIKSETLIRLSTFLQTTLDYQTLLSIFQREIASAVLVDGIVFENANLEINFTLGQLGVHSSNYQLKAQGEFLGDITFYRSTRFREHELANLEALLGTLVYPLRNAMRYKGALNQAYRDPLTGAGNRILLDDSLKREMGLSKRFGYDLSILMIDLDHFKSINDGFGHVIGDDVLKAVVQQIKACIRQTDICFRYGGEEFIVLLNNANIANARLIAERIRMTVSELCIESDKGPLQVTLSTGLAMLKPDDDKQDLIHRADKALYQAKHTGRNKVCVCKECHTAVLE